MTDTHRDTHREMHREVLTANEARAGRPAGALCDGGQHPRRGHRDGGGADLFVERLGLKYSA